jgi:hypothetical protein
MTVSGFTMMITSDHLDQRRRSRTQNARSAADQRPALLQDRGKLLPKGEVLKQEIAARTEGGAERRNQRREEPKHGAARSRPYENSSRTLGRIP